MWSCCGTAIFPHIPSLEEKFEANQGQTFRVFDGGEVGDDDINGEGLGLGV